MLNQNKQHGWATARRNGLRRRDFDTQNPVVRIGPCRLKFLFFQGFLSFLGFQPPFLAYLNITVPYLAVHLTLTYCRHLNVAVPFLGDTLIVHFFRRATYLKNTSRSDGCSRYGSIYYLGYVQLSQPPVMLYKTTDRLLRQLTLLSVTAVLLYSCNANNAANKCLLERNRVRENARISQQKEVPPPTGCTHYVYIQRTPLLAQRHNCCMNKKYVLLSCGIKTPQI